MSSVVALSTFSIQPELRYSPSVCSAGTRTTSKRIAWLPPSRTPITACAVLSSVKDSGAWKVKPSFGCRKRRPRTNPSLGSSP